jgi:hypothetical protein
MSSRGGGILVKLEVVLGAAAFLLAGCSGPNTPEGCDPYTRAQVAIVAEPTALGTLRNATLVRGVTLTAFSCVAKPTSETLPGVADGSARGQVFAQN